jgi:hypothetical protein
MTNRLHRFLFLWGVILLLLSPAAALAVRGPQGVSKTVHNLSTGDGVYNPFDPYVSDNEDQVCIFCHTPHGGSLAGPLWNRALPGHGFTHYTSDTLSSAVGPANRAVGAESLLCLSCHDGSLAMNRIINNSLSGPPTIGGSSDTFMAFFAGILGALIGNAPPFEEERHDLLTDDHPISFSYQSSLEALPEKLHSAADAMAAGVRFFGAGYQLECSSCHDPHVNYDSDIPESDATADERYRPFLITDNTGSALCLACHDK